MNIFTSRMASCLCAAVFITAVGLSTACADKNESAEQAAPAASTTAAEAAIRKRFKSSRPDIVIDKVEPSDVAGFYQVFLQNGPSIYVSEDGQHFFLGDLFTVTDSGFENLAETRRSEERKTLVSDVAREDMIIFSPEGETDAAVYIFTDVDCGYCQKLHQEVPQLNAMGIEVRYLAYPRAGTGTPTYDKMVSAWCADDRQAAMDALKNRKSVVTKKCDNPVDEQFELGTRIGVTGTPAIVTSEGRLLPGYMPAAQLAAIVQQDES